MLRNVTSSFLDRRAAEAEEEEEEEELDMVVVVEDEDEKCEWFWMDSSLWLVLLCSEEVVEVATATM